MESEMQFPGRHKVIAALAFRFFLMASSSPAVAADLVAAGRQIYEHGVLPSGAPLVARWVMGISMSGEQAACAKCHRKSGSGAFEGGNLVAPVTGPALFRLPPRVERRAAPGITVEDFHFRTRPPYDSRSLARTLRTGVTPAGQQLSPLMPRYRLAKADMAALEAYLRQLSFVPSPGVEGQRVHFATVFTPSADPINRQEVMDVLQACFAERFPAQREDGMGWKLHIWDLTGEPSDWPRQLAERTAMQPVFALVSGLGTADWGPVHHFCEATALPCLFPNVDVPGDPLPSQFNFYFSAGVVLEGEVAEHWLFRSGQEAAPIRVVQLFAADDAVARAGAAALAARRPDAGTMVLMRPLTDFSPSGIAPLLSGLEPGDVVVLWLKRAQLEAVATALPEPPDAVRFMASGWLADLDSLKLAPPWRERLRFVYPFDPPGRLDLRMRFNLRPWLQVRGIVSSREKILGNTLAACNLVVEGVAAQRPPLTRDKLVEEIENYPSSMGNAPAPQSFYRFNLGPGQRFSAKGAFVVRFGDTDAGRLEPVSDWIVP